MIRGYSDHAANQRTFLAWVRTAIAIMAFGFLVEKFDLFLEVAAPSLVDRAISLPGQRIGSLAGLALIVLGTAIVAIAAIRFLITAKNIDSEELQPGPGSRIDVALALLLEPISKSFEKDNEAGQLEKAEEILGVVLPANEDPALPLNPGEEALDEPASHVAT
jgi:putative membrane protein